MEYADHVALLAERHAGLAREIARFNTLENVLRWMQDRGFSLASLDVITQDEFSHDVFLPLRPGKGYLVFGIT